jgi:hypothetical protein
MSKRIAADSANPITGWLSRRRFQSGGLLAIIGLVAELSRPGGLLADEPDRGDWFHSLTQPGTNLPCCDVADCEKTSAEWRRDGWWAQVRGKWRLVPGDVVLEHPRSFDGDAYICSADPINDESHRIDPPIYCFVPPDMAS